MEYRSFGKLDFKPSALGFGCMRLPTVGNQPWSPEIIEDEAIKMIRYAIDNGVNYIDTAYPYHGRESERVTGLALKDGYREKVKLATKSPIFLIEEEGDFDRILDEQLAKLGVDYIDFYLLHALNLNTWENKVLKLNIFKYAEKAKASGKIKHLGFSFHDKFEVFTKILNGYDKWEFCQIQLNYLDEDYQAGLQGLHDAAEKGLGVVIMEPLQGGKLTKLPSKINKYFRQADEDKSDTQWALDYLWNKPEISVLLSGMSTMEQVEDNVKYASESGVGKLKDADTDAIEAVKKAFKEVEAVPCTKCSYCLPCPKGVNIPVNFALYNNVFLFEELEPSKVAYAKMEAQQKAENCVSCGACEKKCPQNIKIIKELKEVAKLLKVE